MLRTSSHMRVATRCFASEKHPVIRQNQAVRKPLEDILGETKEKLPVEVHADPGHEVAELSGVPDEHNFRTARESPQTAWNNTKVWKIELDTRQRWENPHMGWTSSGRETCKFNDDKMLQVLEELKEMKKIGKIRIIITLIPLLVFGALSMHLIICSFLSS